MSRRRSSGDGFRLLHMLENEKKERRRSRGRRRIKPKETPSKILRKISAEAPTFLCTVF